MPKIEVFEEKLFDIIGKRIPEDRLEDLLSIAKAEVDDYDRESGIIKIELNDTNRPDLWSTAGLGRQLGVYLGAEIPSYDFFSSPKRTTEAGNRRIVVDPALESIRPYITAFAVTGKKVDDSILRDMIQTQEKLCWNFGQKRKSIAMGIYRSDLIEYPVRYTAADPDTTRFVPLQMDRELSLSEILSEHPKGLDFGSIVAGFPKFPFITDSRGDVLSFPPVINSARIGAVQVGDENLFIEMTGTDLYSLLLAVSIVACDLADAGHTILPVAVEYPFDTPLGREIVMPYRFQEPVSAEMSRVRSMLGVDMEPREAIECLGRMGCRATADGGSVTIQVPDFRNDFLHQVDIIEDIMIGRGMSTFEPVMPEDFTVGRLSREEMFARSVKDVMVGLGFQEMIYNYMGSRRDFIDRMCVDGSGVVRIANPMTENYEYVRNSVFPCLLASEAVSAGAVFPHKIFEVGKIARLDESANEGSVTRNFCSFLVSDAGTGFNEINAVVAALFYYLGIEFTLEPVTDPRLIDGRAAAIVCAGRIAGYFGETHPQVLENWGIQVPCAVCELDLDTLLA